METNEWGLSIDYKNKPVGDDKRGPVLEPELWKQEMTRGNMAVEARDDKREHGCGSKK